MFEVAVNPMLQLFFALATIALACIITYKMALPLALKIMNLCIESVRFRRITGIVLALMFSALGILQLIDFMEGKYLNLSRFFPLSFLISAIMIYLASAKQRHNL